MIGIATRLASSLLFVLPAIAASAQEAAPAAGPDWRRVVAAPELREDLEQLRSILKREWILANLNDADFDAAIAAVEREAKDGLTLAELTFRIQRVLALGRDGHAGVSGFLGALADIPGPRPGFVVDLCGDDYVALVVRSDPLSSVNPRLNYGYRPLKEGYPYLTAIDGRPVAEWVRAATPYVPKGPETAVRWRAMRLLLELPFLRRELGAPEKPGIRVRLMSADRKDEIELDAPTRPYKGWHLQVPRPAWRVIDDRLGYVWLTDTFGRGTETVVEAMPRLRDTKGLILDLRGNEGGNLEPLMVLACYLMRPDRPRRITGRVVAWEGAFPPAIEPGMAGWLAPDSPKLSDEGKALMRTFRAPEGGWAPPTIRPTESRPVFSCRREAEPGIPDFQNERFPETYDYDGPVVALFDHRTFSGGELLLAALKDLIDVTLVGTETSSAAGGSAEFHELEHSGLKVMLASRVYIRGDGTPIDGIGIRPDVRVDPAPEDHVGAGDRMLEKAIEILEGRIAGAK